MTWDGPVNAKIRALATTQGAIDPHTDEQHARFSRILNMRTSCARWIPEIKSVKVFFRAICSCESLRDVLQRIVAPVALLQHTCARVLHHRKRSTGECAVRNVSHKHRSHLGAYAPYRRF